MNIEQIMIPGMILGGLGLTFGLLLAYASKKFYVETDPRVSQVRDMLPGANCGGCGFPGCDGYADAVVTQGAKPNLCPAGGAALAARLAEIMGISVETSERSIAQVICNGTAEMARFRCNYEGARDCREAVVIPGGGHKACVFGCLGLGTCVSVCPFDAVVIKNSMAHVLADKCVGCGACAAMCPKNVIRLVPESKKVRVLCNSNAKGPEVKKACQVGCIGCGMCARACPEEAVTMANNLAVIDYSKCTQCGACALKCPTKAIADNSKVV